jgi:hypothetical protein
MPVRAPLAVLNEQSLPPFVAELSETKVIDLLAEFVVVMRRIHKIRPDLALASAVPLREVPLTPNGQGLAAIAAGAGGRVREHWRYIQSKRNLAPFTTVADLHLPGPDQEYFHDAHPCVGLGVAASSGQLGISFLTDPAWDKSEVVLSRRWLVQGLDSDELTLQEEALSLRHAARPQHVVMHASFIADLALSDPFSGDDLWADRAKRYPRLRFLPHVKSQLRALGHGSHEVRQVHDRLSELDLATEEWDPTTQATPAWKSKVSPEHETRKRLCDFQDVDGVTRCFDLHAYFTPGAGRIHFRLAAEGAHRFLTIAHVGRKLGA